MRASISERHIKIYSIAVSFALLLQLTGATCNAENADESSLISKLFTYAKESNVQAIEQMKADVEAVGNSSATNAYSLALYMANPQKYEDQYVDNFPIDTNGIMHDLYENIELKQLTPSFLFSVESLGKIAIKGNDKALQKILRGSMHADGAVGEMYCDYVGKLLDAHLQRTVTALSRVDIDERKGAYECLKLLPANNVAAVKKNAKKINTSDQKIIQVIKELTQFKQ